MSNARAQLPASEISHAGIGGDRQVIENLVGQLPGAVLVLDLDERIVAVNVAFLDMIEPPAEDDRRPVYCVEDTHALLGMAFTDIISEYDVLGLLGVGSAIEGHERVRTSVIFRGRNEISTSAAVDIGLYSDVEGRHAGYILHCLWQGELQEALAESSRWAAEAQDKADALVRARDELAAAKGQLETINSSLDAQVRRRTEDLRRARDEALQANASKSEFLSTMSHELRTPLNGVVGMAQLLMETDLSAEQRDMADVVLGSSHILLALINDILDFSKIEAGRLDLEVVDFNLIDAIEGCVAIVAAGSQRPETELRCRIGEGVPEFVVGDPTRLRQILMNLLNNAMKFTPRGWVSLEVDGSMRGEYEVWLEFRVTDTGVGIDDEKISSLFNPFVQADASTTRKFGGTGLGLSICRRLVECMRGSIDIRSEVGAGSEFRFDVTLSTELRDQQVTQVPRVGIVPQSSTKVLLVDAEPGGSEGVAAQLVRLGCSVQVMSFDEVTPSWLAAWSTSTSTTDAGPELLVLSEPRAGGADMGAFIGLERPILSLSAAKPAELDVATPGVARAWLARPATRLQLYRALSDLVGRGTGAGAGGDLERKGHGLRVLVADDNAINRRVIAKMLQRLGCTSVLAEDGVQALESLATQSFDVVLMDCHMPKLDGYAATRELRAQPETASLPVFALTADALPENHRRCVDAGMDRLLAKPLSLEDLNHALFAVRDVQGLGES